MEKHLIIDDNRITMHMPQSSAHTPEAVVFLHVVRGNGADVLEQCRNLEAPAFTLVAIEPHSWNDDLAPWKCPNPFADDQPFAGRADAQLRLLERVIIPHVENELPCKPEQRVIAGYSLAGLFAAWAVFNSAVFSSIASASGSFWFPKFTDFAATHSLACPLTCAYFSLGNKESHTSNRLLRNVAQGTQNVVDAFHEKGVPTTFELNPGNHFKEPALRMAKGICHILKTSRATTRTR